MKPVLWPAFLLAATMICSASATLGQEKRSSTSINKPKIIYIVPHTRSVSSDTLTKIRNQAASGSTIALWWYQIRAYDSKNYQGMMVGRSPFDHGHRATTIPTYVIPVALTFADSGDDFDPTAPDGCAPGGKSVTDILLHSPIFQHTDFVLNGVDVGSTQYLDAFQRGNFWGQVGGTPYHTLFSTNPTVLPAISLTVQPSAGQSQVGFCHDLGLLDQGVWDNYVQTTLIPQLAAQGVGPANFPQFVFNSVAMYLNGDPSQCCALGYHNSYSNGGTFQSYSVNEYDNSGVFGNDTSVLSHEVAEWMDDPNGSNPVPAWGAEGQVAAGSCQNNLETGDPLSPGFSTPTNPFTVTMPNGVDYTLQELAYFSWFYGESPSFGSGGRYSNNGTFTGHARPCPPGGTN